jgi:hypothetical protein
LPPGRQLSSAFEDFGIFAGDGVRRGFPNPFVARSLRFAALPGVPVFRCKILSFCARRVVNSPEIPARASTSMRQNQREFCRFQCISIEHWLVDEKSLA